MSSSNHTNTDSVSTIILAIIGFRLILLHETFMEMKPLFNSASHCQEGISKLRVTIRNYILSVEATVKYMILYDISTSW